MFQIETAHGVSNAFIKDLLRTVQAVHVASYRGPNPIASVLARGVGMAMDLPHTRALGVYIAERKHHHSDDVKVQTSTQECLLLLLLWAKSPKKRPILR